MSCSRIQAIDHVHLDAPAERIEQMRAFYGDLLGLPRLENVEHEQDMVLCFGANHLQMRLIVRRRSNVNSTRRRLTIEVDSLDAQAERFREAKVPFQSSRGIGFASRRLFVHDPAGHLIELKQTWPF